MIQSKLRMPNTEKYREIQRNTWKYRESQNHLARCRNFAAGKDPDGRKGAPKVILDTPKEIPITPLVSTT